MKRAVWVLTEPLPVGPSGTSEHKAHGEYATGEAAWAAKQEIQAARPELVGCLLVVMKTVDVVEPVVVVAPPVYPVVAGEGVVGRGGVAAVGASGGGDGVQGAGGGGGHPPDVPALRAAGRGVPRRPVESAVPGLP